MKVNKTMQKMLNRVLVFRYMELLTSDLEKMKISHKEISRLAGRAEGAFNKTINRGEDLKLSSFLRYWNAISKIAAKRNIQLNKFEHYLADNEVTVCLELLGQIQEADFFELVKLEKHATFFKGIKVYIAILSKKNILTSNEVSLYNEILKNITK